MVQNLSSPTLSRGHQVDKKRLAYNDLDAARKVPIQIQAGYGLLEAGTVLALNKSAAGGKDMLLPYCPTTFTGAEEDPGRSYLVADSVALASVVYVTQDDSYKFQVGDDLIINDDTTTAENLGAITAIDRTSEKHRAKITFTTAIGGTAFTTARKAHVLVEAGDNSNNYSDAVAILEKDVNTGVGQYAVGAQATVILGNAILYEGCLLLLDAAAKTDLGASSFGIYLDIP